MAKSRDESLQVQNLTLPIDALVPHARNYRTHPDTQLERLSASLARFSQYRSIVAQDMGDGTYRIVAGHGLVEAAKQQHLTELRADVLPSSLSEEDILGILVADNVTAQSAEDDLEALTQLLQEQANAGYNLESLGSNQDELDALLEELAQAALEAGEGMPGSATLKVTLADRFIVPPFSVLDARQGYWQERKRQWLALGIQSELGRGENAAPGGSSRPAMTLGPDGHTVRGDGYGRAMPGEPSDSQPGKNKNGLLGESEQARSHYKGQYGGTPAPDGRGGLSDQLANRSAGNTLGAIPPNERDSISRSGSYSTRPGAKKGLARTYGQDLMRGEHVVGQNGRKGEYVGGGTLGLSDSGNDPEYYYKKQEVERQLGHEISRADFQRDYYQGPETLQSGTSIFDPVLCELVYRWFSPPDGLVLDPFAGGSVRGIVAAHVGRRYVGIDLRPEQVAANEAQADGILTNEDAAQWIVGDSRNLSELVSHVAADLVFTCPPYYDLEVYSDDGRDLSTASTYQDFLADYRAIVAAALVRLKPDRFACVVVGDIRDPKGFYRNFVADSIAAFQDAGARLYNEAILVTSVGSLPIRVGRQFSAGRKLGKTHQNVLVFVKGDPRKAVEACGPVEITLPEEDQEEAEDLAPAAGEG